MSVRRIPTANQLHAREFEQKLVALSFEAEHYATDSKIAPDHRAAWRRTVQGLKDLRLNVGKMAAESWQKESRSVGDD